MKIMLTCIAIASFLVLPEIDIFLILKYFPVQTPHPAVQAMIRTLNKWRDN